MLLKNAEFHLLHRSGWLRAAVLGANDGILSIASIVSGMAAGGASKEATLLAGLAGLVAGATSMATGEYVSVSSQADTEKADLAREAHELEHNFDFELEELTHIYMARGLEETLARQVAKQLMAHDALGAHARDELGITDIMTARPLQAALASAGSFVGGAVLPLLVAMLLPAENIATIITASTLVALALLGAFGAKMGGVAPLRPMARVLIWGAISLGLTILVGRIFGISA